MGQKILSLLNASLQDKSKYRIRVFYISFLMQFQKCLRFSLHSQVSKNTMEAWYCRKHPLCSFSATITSFITLRKANESFMKRSLFRNIKVLNKLNISLMHKWDVVIKLSFFEKKNTTSQWNIRRHKF